MNENEYVGGAYSGNTETTNTESTNTSFSDNGMYSSSINVGKTGNNNANEANYQNVNYQNRNYPYGTNVNQYGAQESQNVYGNTDAYGNTYGYSNRAPKEPKKKKPIKVNGFVKKAIACVSLGVFFGLFAGISFYAVKSIDTFVQSGNEVTENQDAADAAITEGAGASGIAQAADADGMARTATAVVTDVTDVVDNVMPSVVSVTNNFIAEQQDFFGQTMKSEQSASGSGIIVGESDSELLIVTNYHVVEAADSLKVQFIDGTEADAQMKGSDSGMDLAVMAVQLDTLSADTKNAIVIAKLGDSESLKVGEPAIAIGNALGYGQSVTTGVISAVNRSIVDTTQQATPTGTGSESSSSLIQTDAAINPGNSGGALLNMNGEVVGINSNKIGGTVVEGMGYAIPISSAKPIIEDLMTKTTKIKAAEGEKAYLGISGVDVSSDAASTYGLPEGVYIAQVYEGTAASNAGMIKGDIITKFDGSTVNSMEELQNMLQYYTAGTTVDVTIQQASPTGYKEKTVAVTLGTKPEQQVQ